MVDNKKRINQDDQSSKPATEKKQYKKESVLIRLSSYEDTILKELQDHYQMSKSEIFRHLLHMEHERRRLHAEFEKQRER